MVEEPESVAEIIQGAKDFKLDLEVAERSRTDSDSDMLRHMAESRRQKASAALTYMYRSFKFASGCDA